MRPPAGLRLPPVHIRNLPSAKKILAEEAHQQHHAAGAEKKWKLFFYIACVPGMIALGARAYMKEMEHLEHIRHEIFEEHRKFVPYPHLHFRKKPFYWGDGERSLFDSEFNLHPEE